MYARIESPFAAISRGEIPHVTTDDENGAEHPCAPRPVHDHHAHLGHGRHARPGRARREHAIGRRPKRTNRMTKT